jgi:hypothetical protein
MSLECPSYKVLFLPTEGNFCEFKEINNDERWSDDIKRLVGGSIGRMELKSESFQGKILHRRRVLSITETSTLSVFHNSDAVDHPRFELNKTATDLRAHFCPEKSWGAPVLGYAILIRRVVITTIDESGSVEKEYSGGFTDEDLEFIKDNMRMLP